MKIFITGGLGFIGSNIAEFYSKQGNQVVIFDNLSRFKYLGKQVENSLNVEFIKNKAEIIKADICDKQALTTAMRGADVVFHCAAQTAVTSSLREPYLDFNINCVGTVNVLEAARLNGVKTLLYCSTNKVYGDAINDVELNEFEQRHTFKSISGISKKHGIDLTPHSPYGCSKLAGDIYAQEYGHLYGLKTGVFRMSCIYGKNQFGVEDQGWISWFILCTLLDRQITLYGDGKQVRDILNVTDLVDLFDKFVTSKEKQGVYNVGGGPNNTISLLELIKLLKDVSGKKIAVKHAPWRESDQKVYISDIDELKHRFAWEPKVSPTEGIKQLYDWTLKNKSLFESVMRVL